MIKNGNITKNIKSPQHFNWHKEGYMSVCGNHRNQLKSILILAWSLFTYNNQYTHTTNWRPSQNPTSTRPLRPGAPLREDCISHDTRCQSHVTVVANYLS